MKIYHFLKLTFLGDRLQYYIAVDFPGGESMKAKSNRDVYVYKGDVNLNSFKFTHGPVNA